jgi:hypothetical protein
VATENAVDLAAAPEPSPNNHDRRSGGTNEHSSDNRFPVQLWRRSGSNRERPKELLISAQNSPRLGRPTRPRGHHATTEHFNLQTARAPPSRKQTAVRTSTSSRYRATSSRSPHRADVAARDGLLRVFAALVAGIGFRGVVTFRRLVQSSLEDIAYAQRIARVRDLYVALVHELEPYVLVVRGRPAESLLHSERLRPNRWQLTLTTAGMVAVVNSVVIGASAGLVVAVLGDASLAVMLAAGTFVAVSALSVHRRHHRRAHSLRPPRSHERSSARDCLAEGHLPLPRAMRACRQPHEPRALWTMSRGHVNHFAFRRRQHPAAGQARPAVRCRNGRSAATA